MLQPVAFEAVRRRSLIEPAYKRHAADIDSLVGRALTGEQRRELFELLAALRTSAREETL